MRLSDAVIECYKLMPDDPESETKVTAMLAALSLTGLPAEKRAEILIDVVRRMASVKARPSMRLVR